MGEEQGSGAAPDDWVVLNLELPWTTSVRTAVIEGRRRVVGLRMEPVGTDLQAISAEVLRAFPLRQVLDAVEQLRGPHDYAEEFQLPRREGKFYPRSHYVFVADTFKLASDDGLSPTSVIQKTWGVSRTTAQNWIRRARELDLLPPARQRRL